MNSWVYNDLGESLEVGKLYTSDGIQEMCGSHVFIFLLERMTREEFFILHRGASAAFQPEMFGIVVGLLTSELVTHHFFFVDGDVINTYDFFTRMRRLN